MLEVGAYEAKTRLSELLDKVEAGESITITRHGVPVAVLSRPPRARKMTVEEAIAAGREFRRGRHTSHEEIRAWINEGRR
jgi:antitoxin (DNA-binding transcriptional repressor) of toxin-antitoxin stability system